MRTITSSPSSFADDEAWERGRISLAPLPSVDRLLDYLASPSIEGQEDDVVTQPNGLRLQLYTTLVEHGRLLRSDRLFAHKADRQQCSRQDGDSPNDVGSGAAGRRGLRNSITRVVDRRHAVLLRCLPMSSDKATEVPRGRRWQSQLFQWFAGDGVGLVSSRVGR